jgi:serine O-acetyltransferase
MRKTHYGDYLRVDIYRYWRAYPDEVKPLWRVLMMLFQWELHAVILYRINFHITRMRRPILGYLSYIMQKINEALSGVRLPASACIGPGLFIMHTGCTGFHPLVKIGSNFTIAPGASIAGKVAGQVEGAQIGNNVFLGSGARIIGPVRIGNDVTIGANAVVLEDLPDGAVAVGNPARIVKLCDQPVAPNNPHA